MAEEANLEIEDTGKGKKKLIIIIAAVVLIVGAAAGLGGKLIRTVCFLVSCESPPGAGAFVVSSDIVKKASNKGSRD